MCLLPILIMSNVECTYIVHCLNYNIFPVKYLKITRAKDKHKTSNKMHFYLLLTGCGHIILINISHNNNQSI